MKADLRRNAEEPVAGSEARAHVIEHENIIGRIA